MNRVLKLILAGIFAVCLMLAPMTGIVHAYSGPNLSVTQVSEGRFRINISNAPSYSQVDLYMHQSDSELWNAVQNIGTTDGSGRFATTRNFDSFHPELEWFWYAVVGGQATPSINTGSNDSSRSNQGNNHQSYSDGTLVLDHGTVYQIYRNQKIGFSNESAFLGLGYNWSDLWNGDTSNLSLIGVISYSGRSHPWGTWVLSGHTVYFVHEDGLIPISTYDIFTNNDGHPENLVPINWYDQQLTRLPQMQYNDSRLNDKNNYDKTITVNLGNRFSIKLNSNPSTGYSWTPNYNNAYLALTESSFSPDSTLIGSGGIQTFEFETEKRGTTYITFNYSRSWESINPADTKTYQIIIR